MESGVHSSESTSNSYFRLEAEVEVEGIDESDIEVLGDYPIDALLIRHETRTVRDVVHRIREERFFLDPDYQRDFVWTDTMQSKLIESCLMRIPLPVIYLAELPDGRIAVVDGLQRLSTFAAFLNNELALKFRPGVIETNNQALNGKKFQDLPPKLKDRIEDTQLILYILDEKAPIRAKLDIFERVNSGLKLSRQQMRNALLNGPATHWLKDVAEDKAFKSATGESLSSKSMRDREAANRFVSFTLCGRENYKGDMDDFLADGLIELRNSSQEQMNELKNIFIETMEICHKIFGTHAFRKSMLGQNIEKSVINMSLFDVMSFNYSKHIDKLKGAEHELVKKHIKNLLEDQEFFQSITIFTSSRKAVETRHQKFENSLVEMLSGR